MDIRINSCPINFQLENEREVGDVIGSISQWARERDLIFVEAHIDDMSYALDTIPTMPLDGVKSINCIVQSKADAVISSLREGMAYCTRIIKFIDAAVKGGSFDVAQIELLAGGIDWLNEIIITSSNLMGVSPEEIRYRDVSVSVYTVLLNEMRLALDERPEGKAAIALLDEKKTLFESMRDIFRLLLGGDHLKRLIIQSIDSPDVLIKSMREIRDSLDEQMKNISGTVMAYQTGRDSEGAERLQVFVDFIYLYLRTCFQAAPVFQLDFSRIESGGITVEEKNARLNDLLNEMLAALENNDIISLSDILEYEIRPELENLGAFLESLLGAIETV